jgi:transposase
LQPKVTLTMRDLTRYQVVQASLEGRTEVGAAAEVLGLSERQVYRLRRRVREEGVKGVVHRLRGRRSHRRLSEEVWDRVVRLYEEKYKGFNMSHYTEYLNEEEGIGISRETVRRILRVRGVYERKARRQPKHRQSREPMAREGQMTQMDTSPHRWLPGWDRRINLVCLVDDATNKIQAGWVVEHDGTVENMRVLKMCFRSKGLPWSLYLDRDSKFKTTRRGGCHIRVGEDQGDTQIQRAMEELGVEMIYAGSPQAKGRIERDFRTLQDRFINELRLNGITTIDGANNYLWEEFIPKWNRRFGRSPREEGSCYRPLPAGMRLDDILCLKYERRVYQDNTISHDGQKYQILPDRYRANYSRARVEFRKHLNGKTSVVYKGRRLKHRKITRLTKEQKRQALVEDALTQGDISILQNT